MPDRKRILFVDDEQKVIDGLKRMLFPMRNTWEMVFVSSAKKALDLIKEKPFDVVVSDMRMPEMDGSELLSKIKEINPQTIRFILSGYSEQEMILKTVKDTDQFLTKPCSAVELKEVISKALSAQGALDNKQKLIAMASKMDQLPSLPTLYIELKKLLDSSSSSFDDISAIIAKDIFMTAKILQMVNSAFFGLRHKIKNINQAAVFLGIKTIKGIIITADVFSKFTAEEIEDFGIKELYRHSVLTGVLAGKIAGTISPKLVDQASMAGMLHDIGKIIFIRNEADKYRGLVRKSIELNQDIFCLEEAHMEINHAEIGGYLMSLWRMDSSIANAISSHHNPSTDGDSDSVIIAAAVYVADRLYQEICHPEKESYRVDINYLKDLKLERYLDEWRAIAETVMEHRDETDQFF